MLLKASKIPPVLISVEMCKESEVVAQVLYRRLSFHSRLLLTVEIHAFRSHNVIFPAPEVFSACINAYSIAFVDRYKRACAI